VPWGPFSDTLIYNQRDAKQIIHCTLIHSKSGETDISNSASLYDCTKPHPHKVFAFIINKWYLIKWDLTL